MQVATGKSILNGIAIGSLRIYKKAEVKTSQTSSLTPEEEWKRFETAKEKAQEQLGGLYDKALDEVGEDNAAIFEIHQMMLDDDDYLEAIQGIIKTQGATAEYATETTGENFSAAFAAMDDEYMRARATDVKDISRRVVNILTGAGDSAMQDDQPAILVADDLTPSETVQLDKSKLLGFITRHGSSNSHTAILARTMNIPALIGVDFDDSWDGQTAVLDGYNHCVYIDPAAVMMANELAEEVDFFSLGTNDLTQYALAIDRQNPKLDNFYDPYHPAILRMIKQTVEAGHRHGCWVGICGELGADEELTAKFVQMGIDELSVSPGYTLDLRKRIREC